MRNAGTEVRGPWIEVDARSLVYSLHGMGPPVGLLRALGVAVVVAVLLAGCGGGGTADTSSGAVTHLKASVTQPTPSEGQSQAAQRKKEATRAKRRELRDRRAAAAHRRREAARRHREAAEKLAEEHLGHGLGARKAIFNAENTVGAGPDPPPGVAWYHVLFTIGGRVAAFNIDANFKPAWSAHELITLMAAHNLPEDAQIVTEHESCIVWRSPTLGRLLGNEDAEGFVEPGTPGYAELITTSEPECE